MSLSISGCNTPRDLPKAGHLGYIRWDSMQKTTLRVISTSLRPVATALFLLSQTSAFAALAPHAPSLSVHENAYGTVTEGEIRESIQGLEIKLVSHAEPDRTYQVECFFLKKGKKGALPTVDDAVFFNVVNPHAVFEVKAKPIKLGSLPKKAASQTGKPSKSSKKGGSSSNSRANESPREGYVVRVLSEGILLRESFSNHAMEELIAKNPEILAHVHQGKSIRHLSPEDLRRR
jgi:hypothetical protein